MRPTTWSLFEPHYKQNLYTNPKRTAKSSLPNPFPTVIDSMRFPVVQKVFVRGRDFFAARDPRAETTAVSLQLPARLRSFYCILPACFAKPPGFGLPLTGVAWQAGEPGVWVWAATRAPPEPGTRDWSGMALGRNQRRKKSPRKFLTFLGIKTHDSNKRLIYGQNRVDARHTHRAERLPDPPAHPGRGGAALRRPRAGWRFHARHHRASGGQRGRDQLLLRQQGRPGVRRFRPSADPHHGGAAGGPGPGRAGLRRGGA